MPRRICSVARLAFAFLICAAAVLDFGAKAAAAESISGDGTAESPYIITSVSDLKLIAENPSAHYVLGNDIDLNGSLWTPICDTSNAFTGVFDGNRYKIKNLKVNSADGNIGLFGCIGKTGVVKNLDIDSGRIESKGNTAGIAAVNYGKIICCCNKAQIIVKAQNQCLGGIAAQNCGLIENCFNAGKISGLERDTAGGIAGKNISGKVINCYNIGQINTTSKVGGITGTGQCENCHFLEQNGLLMTGDGSPVCGESSAALKTQSTYKDWDFETVWSISPDVNDGYPYFRNLSGSALLMSLNLSEGTLSPAFRADVFEYTAVVGSEIESITVEAVAEDSSASVLINGSDSGTVSLRDGENTVNITVTAQDGTKITYTIKIVRAHNFSAKLSSLSLSDGTLSPAFNPDVFYYTASVGYDVSSVTVLATAECENAVVRVNGKTDCRVDLKVGTNVLSVEVTAKDGTTNTYTVKITRSGSDNAALKSLSLSFGTLSPAFNPDILYYSATVPRGVSSVTVVALPADDSAVVAVNGSGSRFTVSLNYGKNTAAITVTSQSGTVKTYIITITRSLNDTALLRLLSLSAGTLSPAFSPERTFYTADVDYSVSRLVVIPIAADGCSAVFVNGGAAGEPIELSEGSNKIDITVVAADGSAKVYTIVATRGYSNKVTVTTPDEDGFYSADLPSYAAALNADATFSFILGDVTVTMPVSQVQLGVYSGGAKISKGSPSRQSALEIASYVPDGLVAADAFSLYLSGGITQLSSCVEITINLDDRLKELLKNGFPEIYYYDPQSHSFDKLDSVLDITNSTLKFSTTHFSTFVITVAPDGSAQYRYELSADDRYTLTDAGASFSVEIIRQSGSPVLYGGSLLVVTTLSSGRQTYSTFALDGDRTALEITVDPAALQSSLYLITGGFDGSNIPTSYTLVQFVKRR